MEVWRIPAFGEWNHRYADDAVVVDDDWSVMSERFNCALRAPVTAYEPIKRATARRHRRIPPFGEWNTADRCRGSSNEDWPVVITPCFEPAKPWVTMSNHGAVVGKQWKAVVRHGLRTNRVADVGSNTARKPYYVAVVQAVDDDDLYEVPPDLLHRKAMEKGGTWLRGFLIACFRCLNCTA